MFDLSQREKKVIRFGLGFIVLFFGFRLGIAPVFEKRENLERILKEKQAALAQMIEQQQQFFKISNTTDDRSYALAHRKKDFSLFSFLDSQVQQTGVRKNVVYMKPFTKEIKNEPYTLAIVKVKLTDVYLKELVDFLFRIETSTNGVTITSLSLSKTGKEKNRLDAIIETETLMNKAKG